jgi:NTP pyrophosphatase (non-canonical NTP hydrolase)
MLPLHGPQPFHAFSQPNDTKPAPTMTAANEPDISLRDFQSLIRTMYYEKDAERGVSGTFMWLMEEMGELASALRSNNDRDNLEEEFADVIAWLTTIANVAGIDLAQAIAKKYGSGCPGCKKLACDCPMSEKP